MKPRFAGALRFLCFTSVALAQAPTGTITGIVTDPSGAAIAAGKVTLTNHETGLTRTTPTATEGTYAAPALPAGVYEVRAEAAGFRLLVRDATVQAGTTTAVDFAMQVGAVTEVVNVGGAAPQIKFDNYKIDGVVTREQIENLPLNGRNFLELAKLEPGVTVANVNTRVDVSALGAGHAVVTIDGGSVNHYVDGTSRNHMSQDAVEEFQMSTVNFDLSTGGASGSINIVTRSGGNDYHGGGFFLYRDHTMAAYPALKRDAVNPDPFFRRRQEGMNLGGPIQQNRLFFFGNYEGSKQDGISGVQPQTPEFAPLGGVFALPGAPKQFSLRSDIRASNNNNLFLRFSDDDASGLGINSRNNALPSSWSNFVQKTYQGLAGFTTAMRPNLVNEGRLSFNYFGLRGPALTRSDCPGECFGIDSPFTTISGVGFMFGKDPTTPFTNVLRRSEVSDSLSWQKGVHRTRFGGGWERFDPAFSNPRAEPASLTLYSPASARAAGIPIPRSFSTVEDVMRLPLLSFQTGIGDPKTPPYYNFDQAKRWSVWRFYWQDTWRVRPNFTFNYGLSWSYDTFPLNHDLSKPNYLQPILGAQGLAPSRNDPNNFGPAAGFAWAVTKDNKTVIRGGAGIYYDQYLWIANPERTTLSPRGGGRSVLDGSYVPNPTPDIPGVPVGRALDFRSAPTMFRGADLIAILPWVRAGLQQLLGDPHNTDLSVRNIQMFKQQTTDRGLFTQDFTTAYAEHFNIGIQREIARDLVVSADFAFKQFIHTDMGGVDYNHFDSVRGPLIRPCVSEERLDPKAACSTGPILVDTSGGRSHYKALLVRVDKRFSRRTQFLASYALSSNVGFNGTGTGFNKENWFENFVPLDTDRRHVLNVTGMVDLPKRFQVSFISSMVSKAPFSAFLANLDFNGDGTTGDVLPGTKANQFNRGLGKSDLIRLVDQFNQSLAGTKTSRGQTIPKLTLPTDFEFGRSYITQDLRLSRSFLFHERIKLTPFGEVFNLFNIANLSGHSGNLQQTSAFGQATQRAAQVFGSGGPRAFQFGARVSF